MIDCDKVISRTEASSVEGAHVKRIVGNLKQSHITRTRTRCHHNLRTLISANKHIIRCYETHNPLTELIVCQALSSIKNEIS